MLHRKDGRKPHPTSFLRATPRSIITGNDIVITGNDPQHSSSSKKNVKQPKPTITDNAPSLWVLRVVAGYDPRRRCGLRPATPQSQQPTQKKTSDNSAHHYGQSPVVAGIARHRGLRPAIQQPTQKNVGQQRPPLRITPRRCGHCASLRALRIIAGIAHHRGLRPANNSRRKKKRQTTTPTITDNVPSLRATTRKQQPTQKKRRTTTPTITDNAPSLRAMRVIAGNDPQSNSRRKKSVGQNKQTKKQK